MNKLAINRSTIRRTRISTRNHVGAIIQDFFTSEVPVTVHLDEKLLLDLTGKGEVDLLPVLVSVAGVTKLLGVPKRPSGTGKVMNEAVLGCLED